MVTLYQDYFEKRYSAKLFSCSTLIVGILFLSTIILPYIITYITNGTITKSNNSFRHVAEGELLL